MHVLKKSDASSDSPNLVGYVQESNQSCSTNDLLNDGKRVEYMAGYLDALLRTIR